MWLNNTNSTEQEDSVKNTLKNTSDVNLEEQGKKIDELKNEWEVQKWKDLVQAEIMSHFIQNPNDNVMMSMRISKDPEDLCEMVDFEDAQYEDKNLNMLFNWWIGQKLWWITIKADETWEKWEEFTKELVIDRKTDSKWMLFIWKKWFKLEKVDFEDISKFESQFESYYVYRKEWNTYIKIIKNEIATVNVVNRDSDIKHEINFKQDDLEKINVDEIFEAQEELVKALKEQKENNTLDIFLEVIIKQMQIPEDAKNVVKEELRKLAESN